MIKVFASVFFILLVNLAAGRDYYVDASNGSDLTGDGTLDKPYQTIQKAASLAVAGETIYIRRGIYRETVTQPRSGNAGNPIVFTSYQNEEVIISGADLISNWTLEPSHPSGKVWKTTMSTTRNQPSIPKYEAGMDQVFLDGVMQPEARWPNITVNPATVDRSTYATVDAGAVQGTYTDGQVATVKYRDNDLSLSQNIIGAYIHFIPGFFWWPATGKITARSGNELTFEYTYKSGVYYTPRSSDIYYLWGKYELLDAPGEWFRKSDGTLYLYTPQGDSPNNHLVEIKKREDVFDLRDRAYITLKNIKLRGGRIRTNSASTHVTIDGIDATYMAHYSIVPGWWNINYLGGAVLSGANSSIINSHLAYTVEDGIALNGNNSRAYNNVIHDAGYLGMSGLLLSCTGDDMEVKNNTVWGSGGSGALDFRFAKRSKIWYNDAAESGKGTFDGGILMGARRRNPNIDFDAENTEVAYNYIHDGMGISDGARGFYGTSGIYFEGDLENYLVHHNVIWNTGGGINIPNGNSEHNRNFKIYNNTLYNTPFVMRADLSGSEIKNNIFSRFAGEYNNTIPIENNLSTDVDYRTTVHPSNKFEADPKYTDPINRNFIPATGSPLIDGGLVLPPFTNGFRGTAPDIGALEKGKPAFIAGALVRPQDVANITVTYDTTAFPNKKFKLAGLPPGRKINSNTKLRIGTAASGGDIVGYDYVSNQVYFINVPKENLTGIQPIYVDLGTEGVHATSSTVNLEPIDGILVYPNPSRGDFYIKVSEEYQDKEANIQVFALDGRLVKEINLDTNKTEVIQLTVKGMYILKATIEDKTFTRKIFVQ